MTFSLCVKGVSENVPRFPQTKERTDGEPLGLFEPRLNSGVGNDTSNPRIKGLEKAIQGSFV